MIWGFGKHVPRKYRMVQSSLGKVNAFVSIIKMQDTIYCVEKKVLEFPSVDE